ncbi:hypothetical protein ACFYPX_17060 [Micromonospora zamorensis]|uniref:hypothetical protein n=1 Tax=Micromonospora zamorensis TaxID=709883 RepID=UPI0036C5E529
MAESAVRGVPHPRSGETVRAYVVPAPCRRARQGKKGPAPAGDASRPTRTRRHPHGGNRWPLTPGSL